MYAAFYDGIGLQEKRYSKKCTTCLTKKYSSIIPAIGNRALGHAFVYFRTKCNAISYKNFVEKSYNSSTVGVNKTATVRSVEQSCI